MILCSCSDDGFFMTPIKLEIDCDLHKTFCSIFFNRKMERPKMEKIFL